MNRPTKLLNVVVDFDHSPGDVTCWFNQFEDDDRLPLRVQDLYNVTRRLRRGDDDGWSAADRAFFAMIWPDINKPYLLKENRKVVKVSRARFEHWLATTDNVLERFTDRSTGLAYGGAAPIAPVHFELEGLGDRCRLSAHVTLPNGDMALYRQLRYRPTGTEPRFQLNDQVMRIDTPISRDMLNQLFGEREPLLPTDAVAAHLPTLLDYRLDRLSGPAVVVRSDEANPVVRVRSDGADAIISVGVGTGRLYRADAESAIEFTRDGDRFVVTNWRSSFLQPTVDLLFALPLEPLEAGAFRLSGTAINMGALAAVVRDLPDDVRLIAAPELASLFAIDSTVEPSIAVRQGKGWFDIDVTCHRNGVTVSAEEILSASDGRATCVRSQDGYWLALPAHALQRVSATLDELGLELGTQRVPASSIKPLLHATERFIDLRIHRSSAQLVAEIRRQPPVEPLPLSPPLRERLRPYQVAGVEFLHDRTASTVGCLLADDMGLGKTVQVLALMQAMNVRGTLTSGLVVCPASVVSVWLMEAAEFAPDLRIRALTCPAAERREILADDSGWDVLVATYAVVRQDIYHFRDRKLDLVVLDEAQQIKNPDAGVTLAVKRLSCTKRVALTGTPVENRTLDLWSIMDFLNPGLLGERTTFEQRYAHPGPSRRELGRRVAPLLLRRKKDEVAPELPPRIEEVITIPLSSEQRTIYDRELAIARQRVADGNAVDIFAALTRLRQLCCHPELVTLSSTTSVAESAKLVRLMDMVRELIGAGHSVLIFSQFTRMLTLIEHELEQDGIGRFRITGETPVVQRPEIVQAFTDSAEPAVFLLSLRAAGTGLTLTKADYVFLFDPWWNPAVESQAIDRTHRIGQERPVVAYRLITADTVEEKVMQLQIEKRALFAEVVDGASDVPDGLNLADLQELLG